MTLPYSAAVVRKLTSPVRVFRGGLAALAMTLVACGSENADLIGIYAFREAGAERQRAVVGLTDLSARVHVRKQLGDHLMTFAVPLAMFEEMEGNVAGSFLERPTWQSLVENR